MIRLELLLLWPASELSLCFVRSLICQCAGVHPPCLSMRVFVSKANIKRSRGGGDTLTLDRSITGGKDRPRVSNKTPPSAIITSERIRQQSSMNRGGELVRKYLDGQCQCS